MSGAGRPDEPVASPCRKICVVDPARRVCCGCHRTLDEIAAWRGLSDADKRRVLAELPARRAAAGE